MADAGGPHSRATNGSPAAAAAGPPSAQAASGAAQGTQPARPSPGVTPPPQQGPQAAVPASENRVATAASPEKLERRAAAAAILKGATAASLATTAAALSAATPTPGPSPARPTVAPTPARATGGSIFPTPSIPAAAAEARRRATIAAADAVLRRPAAFGALPGAPPPRKEVLLARTVTGFTPPQLARLRDQIFEFKKFKQAGPVATPVPAPTPTPTPTPTPVPAAATAPPPAAAAAAAAVAAAIAAAIAPLPLNSGGPLATAEGAMLTAINRPLAPLPTAPGRPAIGGDAPWLLEASSSRLLERRMDAERGALVAATGPGGIWAAWGPGAFSTLLKDGVVQINPVTAARIRCVGLSLRGLQRRVRGEVEAAQLVLSAMAERNYLRDVRAAEKARADAPRAVRKAAIRREKDAKLQRADARKLGDAFSAARESRAARGRAVVRFHQLWARDWTARQMALGGPAAVAAAAAAAAAAEREARMEVLRREGLEAYSRTLAAAAVATGAAAGGGEGGDKQGFAALQKFLEQTDEYLRKLTAKIGAVKAQKRRTEAAAAARAAATAAGLDDAAASAAAEAADRLASAAEPESEPGSGLGGGVNRGAYYASAHAMVEVVTQQPHMMRAGLLREYQVVGLQWMVSLYNNRLNGILADEMGLGKTVQVMALIGYLLEKKANAGPHLIVVPNACIVNWRSEFKRWLPGLTVITYVGSKRERAAVFADSVAPRAPRGPFHVLVTSYEFAMRDRARLAKVDWGYLVVDEAQRLKDSASQLSRDLAKLRVQRRLLLTGTPLQNDLQELWALLNLLLPDVFDNRATFDGWFGDAGAGGGPDADGHVKERKMIVIQRLHQILEPFMLRRRLEDVESALPPKTSHVLRTRFSAEQALTYDWVKATGTLRQNPLEPSKPALAGAAYGPLHNRFMELRKVCNHIRLAYPDPYAPPPPSHAHGPGAASWAGLPPGYGLGPELITSSGKAWALDNVLVKLRASGHRVLLFSTMTKLLDVVERALCYRAHRGQPLPYRRIDGTTPLEGREEAIGAFNAPGSDVFIFLLSIRAAGRGLNLQTADTVIIYDPDPNPKNEEQAVARAHRIGQKREVLVLYLEAAVSRRPLMESLWPREPGGSIPESGVNIPESAFAGSVETLVRSVIQRHKIAMADEVINAGHFDMTTTHEQRKEHLEALLLEQADGAASAEAVSVPSLSEINAMVARGPAELALFESMDKDSSLWDGPLATDLESVAQWLKYTRDEQAAATLYSSASKLTGPAKKAAEAAAAAQLAAEHASMGRGRRARGAPASYAQGDGWEDDEAGNGNDDVIDDGDDDGDGGGGRRGGGSARGTRAGGRLGQSRAGQRHAGMGQPSLGVQTGVGAGAVRGGASVVAPAGGGLKIRFTRPAAAAAPPPVVYADDDDDDERDDGMDEEQDDVMDDVDDVTEERGSEPGASGGKRHGAWGGTPPAKRRA